MSDSGKPTREDPPVEQLDFFQGSQFPREQKKNLPGFLRASPRMDTAHSSHILFNQLNHKQLRFKEGRDSLSGGGESGMSTRGWEGLVVVPDGGQPRHISRAGFCGRVWEIWIKHNFKSFLGFPGGSMVKNMPANAGDIALIPGLGRSHMQKDN